MERVYIPKIYEHPGQILVFKEKYGNRYFIAETKEHVYAACLKLLKEREWMFEEPEAPNLIDIPDEPVLFDNSVNEQLREEVMLVIDRAKKTNRKILDNYKEAKEEYGMVKTALSEDNGEMAWRIMSDRRDCEYEYFEFAYLENAK